MSNGSCPCACLLAVYYVNPGVPHQNCVKRRNQEAVADGRVEPPVGDDRKKKYGNTG